MNDLSTLYVNKFNFHDVALGERRVLFHIPSSGLFELDGAGKKLIDFMKENAETSYQEIAEVLDEPSEGVEVSETIENFVDLGIISRSLPVPDRGMDINIKNFPINTIVLNVNTGCNLSCTYCYKEDLTTPTKGEKMDFQTAKDSIDLLLKEAEGYEKINVVFFGGEPLSNLPLIKQVIQYTEDRCQDLGKKPDFSLTTNATMLTEEIVDYLDKHKVGISISMDGPQAIHDRRRITISGQGTYAVVAEKAKMLINRYRSRPVGVRVTLTTGFTDVVHIHKHLKEELGFSEVGIAPATSTPVSGFALNEDELVDVFESMKVLGREYRDAALAGRNNGFSNMHQLMTDLYEGRKKALPCGAGVGLLAVDNKGGLNLCHRFTGSDMPLFGNVRDGIAKEELSEFIKDAGSRVDKGCSTCRIRNLCAGGCYHESYAHFDDPHSPTYHYCDLMRDWVDFGIEVYSEILAKNPQFFKRHLGARSQA